MAYQVALLNFEGPLHLLLQLIEQSELEITEISLSDVTQQYLAYINQLHDLDPADLNQFIDLAARLIHIKSQALLPTLDQPALEEDISQLTAQLAEYRRYQKATAYLQNLLQNSHPSWNRRTQAVAMPEHMPLPTIGLAELKRTFDEVIAKLPVEDPEQRRRAEAGLTNTVTIEEMMEHIVNRAKHSSVAIKELLTELQNRVEAVVMFLGLLELIRHRTVAVTQDQPFGDIMVIYG